jgi:rhodanese-related sulfurtransferase
VTSSVPGSAVRDLLRRGDEIAIVDVRSERLHATGHPLFASSMPSQRLAALVPDLLPRRDVPVVVLGATDDDAAEAAATMIALGFVDAAPLDGGVDGWVAGGGELFTDVNAPSKAFGELVEARAGTPSIAAGELRDLLAAGADIALVDARTFDEHRTMTVPGSRSVPGAELVARVGAFAPDETTTIVVHCAGRTRSIIGTQSLIDAGVANRVVALRNGTIGWTLAGLALERGDTARVDGAPDLTARERAADVARRAGVVDIDHDELAAVLAGGARTVYRFDVRPPDEHRRGHPRGFVSVPGGQLVQETDAEAPVRGALVVLHDDLGVRAQMTGAWLAQMGWDVRILAGPAPTAVGIERSARAGVPAADDPYVRPYVGTAVPPAVMQAYLDWEHGLVEQLGRDGTHGFWVLGRSDAPATGAR